VLKTEILIIELEPVQDGFLLAFSIILTDLNHAHIEVVGELELVEHFKDVSHEEASSTSKFDNAEFLLYFRIRREDFSVLQELHNPNT
jgi:hypothetical protein